MEGTAALICPKCRGSMRTYERNGVLVDQCEECRGIFLDRGELERLIDMERSGEYSPPARTGHEDRGHDEHDRRDDDRQRRRRTSPASLLGDLLGGGGE